ncbi:sulfuric ester hydrolase [Aureococcus anophagefferens]|nr:sulfuric ester hydrolase [Aureococcus anophagefferens]
MAITSGDKRPTCEDWVAIDNCDAWLRNRDSDAPFFLHCSLNIPHPSFETNATWLKAVNWTAGKATGSASRHAPLDAYESSSRPSRAASPTTTSPRLGLLGHGARRLHGDHGEMNMEHRQVWKNSMYEASARVPLILGGGALPAGLKRGSVETGLATLLDIFPR